jgi:sugar phosphate permease
MAQDERPVAINISAIPVAGIGGLGLVAMAGVVAVFFPAIGWMMAAAVTGGVLLGVALVVLRRIRRQPGPSGDDPRILFAAGPTAPEKPSRAPHLEARYSTL